MKTRSLFIWVSTIVLLGCGREYPAKDPSLLEDTAAFHAEMIEASDTFWAKVSFSTTPATNDIDELEMGIGCLENIVSGTEYSPHLAKAWLKWRTRTQLYWHGASRLSEIPNETYNERRKALVKIIRLHLKDHPGDQVARKQLDVLMTTPDIEPLPVGNSAVMDWAGEL